VDRIDFKKVVSDDYKIFIDTSSLLQDNSENVFFKVIAPLLCLYNRKIYIPLLEYNEIDKLSRSNKKNIKSGVNILTHFTKNKLVYKVKSTDINIDNNIISFFSSKKLRKRCNLCLITNDYNGDNNLAQVIINLNNDHSVDTIHDILVFYIDGEDIVQYENQSTRTSSSNESSRNNEDYQTNFKRFNLPNIVETGLEISSISIIPKVGYFVLDKNGKKYHLEEKLGKEGGEGIVYITSKNGYVCKIYKKDKNSNFKFKKIRLLTSNKININGVCFPEHIAYNENNEFIGYFMKKADGVEMKTSICIPPLLKKKFPIWTRINLAHVAKNFLDTVKKIHEYNIILGDINPRNILITDDHNIHFIDTDSFQIEGYPCPVGLLPYTRIENHAKNYSEYIRTKDDDIFATMTLLFQILLPGKLPYSHSGGGSEKENMKPANFPYRCYYDESTSLKAPKGQWRYIWSHLPRKLKALFCKIFKQGEKINLDEVIKSIEDYIYQLDKGYQTDMIFPDSFKELDQNGHVIPVNRKSHF